MKARNFEDLEKIRKSTRACILFHKRYAKYYMVDYELENAIGNPQKIQSIVDSVPIVAQDISSGDFMLQYAAVHKMEFIIVQLKDHAATQALVQRGIVPHLLRFLETCPGFVQALGAMACAQDLPPQYRDALLNHGAATELAVLLEPLVELPMFTVAQGSEEATLLYRGVKTLPSLCSGDPLPAFHLVEILIPSLRRILIVHIPIGIYSKIITDACVTLYYILENLTTDRLQEYVNAELCLSLILLMQGTNEELDEAVHLILRNLIYSQVLVQVLLDEDVIHRLLQIIQDGFGDVEVKELAVSILAQAVRHGTVEDINLLVNLGCIQPLCEYLNNIVTRAYCIIGLRKIIQKGNEQRVGNANIYAVIIGQVGGDTIRSLQNDGQLGSIARWIMMYI
ncbi:importin subunit alpha-like [Chenopodium quinoa]|uniref:importin subunit alpha-like n=1 Tax=Chenopodium quinoa TaxID=63459 RepID=UPI000B77F1EE|nr:importin subunit alpha-like [Chenopodium quinoa]